MSKSYQFQKVILSTYEFPSALSRLLRITLLTIAFAVSIGAVQAQSRMAFNLRLDQQATSSTNDSYFAYDGIPAGTLVSDTVVVNNASEEPIHLHLYPADAITADNGGVAFSTALGEQATNVGAWLNLAESEIKLAAGESRAVPFTFAVPTGITGEQVAGIVAQNAQMTEATEGQFGVNLVQRAAITVLVRIPGPSESRLKLNAVEVEATGGQQSIIAKLHNSGRLGLKAKGFLSIRETDGTVVRDIPVQLGYLVPQEQLNYRFALIPDLPASKYDVALSLTYYDHLLSPEQGQPIEHTTRLTLPPLETLPVVDGERLPAPPLIAGVPTIWLIAAAGVTLFFALLFIIQSMRLRRAQHQRTH